MSDLTLALTALTGGGTGSLDKIDGAGLSAGDAAVVVLAGGVYYYTNIQDSRAELDPFTIRPDTNPGTNSWHLVGTSAKIGALVKKTSNESIDDTTGTALSWAAETYDIGNFWAIGNPTRFTIPVGVTEVIVKAGTRFANDQVGMRNTYIYINGASYEGRPSVSIDAPLTNANLIVVSPRLSVSASDYLEAYVFQSSGAPLDVEAHDTCWFSIEAVGFA